MVNHSSAVTGVPSFKGKAALVFGGTAGIGRSAALAFASAGANVFISGLGASDGREVEAEARSKGVDAAFMEADVTHASEVQAVVSRPHAQDVRARRDRTSHSMVVF
jgi:NAD(P)-dependent dehydrogenase (short-subunit alcohol dehydrogenase family)